jgi:hypothetical protein
MSYTVVFSVDQGTIYPRSTVVLYAPSANRLKSLLVDDRDREYRVAHPSAINIAIGAMVMSMIL